MVARRYWDNWVHPNSYYPASTPPPVFSADSEWTASTPIVAPSLRPITWSDIHPRDSPREPPPEFPNNSMTSYLGPKDRLSLVWINRWTITCMLILAKLLLSGNSLMNGLQSARSETMSACEKVEVAGSSLVSIPHYMSIGANELVASGIESSVSALVTTLDLLITGVEEILLFVIDMVIGTYVCLATMAIDASVGTVLNGTQAVITWVNGTLVSLATQINSEIDTFNSALSNVQQSVEKVGNFFSGQTSLDWPVLSIPEINELNNLAIPSAINDKLSLLESNLPTFAEVKNATKNALKIPFDTIKDLVNTSMSDYSFDRNMLSVPSKDKLSFCSDDQSINDLFDNLERVAHEFFKTAIILLIIFAIVSMLPMGWYDMRKWTHLRRRVYILTQALTRTDKRLDPIDSFDVATSPFSNYLGLLIARPLSSINDQALTRWFVSYITYPPALLLICLGIASLAAAIAQLYVIHKIEANTGEVAFTAGKLTGTVAAILSNKSIEWANSTNTALSTTETDINNNMFSWIWGATSSVNNTLNIFVDDMMTGLNDVFGDTPLYDPIKDVLDCLILLKIHGIQQGLTWVNSHAEVSLPRVNETILLDALMSQSFSTSSNTTNLNSSMPVSLNQTTLNFKYTPRSLKNIKLADEDGVLASNELAELSSKTESAMSSALSKLVSFYRTSIQIEFYFAGGLIGIWGVIVIMGVIRCLTVKHASYKVSSRLKNGRNYYSKPRPDGTQFKVKPNDSEVPVLSTSPVVAVPIAIPVKQSPSWLSSQSGRSVAPADNYGTHTKPWKEEKSYYF
ncbi:hypothetical protein V1514DRAFT_177778 [Lipomyces japonicus]|uniref:uncharacterized protein n=1 Tax=Lipomyces japonicus TaxID=56871 RepID=UPI0034CD8643